jgi:hypothetical protein
MNWQQAKEEEEEEEEEELSCIFKISPQAQPVFEMVSGLQGFPLQFGQPAIKSYTN